MRLKPVIEGPECLQKGDRRIVDLSSIFRHTIEEA
jgi:hypothetical protein